MHLILAIAINVGAAAPPSMPWLREEHYELADSAFQIVLRQLGEDRPSFPPTSGAALGHRTDIWRGQDFAQLTANLAASDGKSTRYQMAGRTVFEQLRQIKRADLEEYWDKVAVQLQTSESSNVIDPPSRTSVGNYLMAHLAALHVASMAGKSRPTSDRAFRLMLVYEALAQGFLADAHASGHLLVPRHDPFQGLHPVNNHRAHDHYNGAGVFVLNGRYEAWEAFGDGALTWYPRSFRQVLQASVTSLRELFSVYFEASGVMPDVLRSWLESMVDGVPRETVAGWLSWKEGEAYYQTEAALPSLSYIPMPISASWSLRSNEIDETGTRVRRHYPQFREPGYHDEDLLGVARENLYSRESLPARFVPPALQTGATPLASVQSSINGASVEFVQDHHKAASFAGLVTEVGAGILIDADESSPALSARLGYGVADNMLIASHVSINAGITYPLQDDRPTPVSLTAGLNPLGSWLRTEIGYASTAEDLFSDSGLALSAALDLTSGTLGFTYIGVSFSARYAVYLLDETVHVPSLQIVFH